MTPPQLSLIMPCYNRCHDLRQVLTAYDQQRGDAPFEVIAVDDASTDGTAQLLRRFQPNRYELRVVSQPENKGPAAARNRGIEMARAPLIGFVGDDIVPGLSFVDGHLAAHQREPDETVAVLGHVRWADDLPQNTLMKHIDGIGAQQFSYRYLQHDAHYDYRHFYTANISLKRAALLRLQRWFDPSFPYAGFEDAELAFRLAQKGMKIRYDATVRCQHYHYHTLRTFARRQMRCGQSAWLFIKKHPAVSKDILPRFHRHVLGLLVPRLPLPSPERIREQEEEAFALAGEFEWTPHPQLDRLYLALLHYFYLAGVYAEFATAGWLRRILLAQHARAVLQPALRAFRVGAGRL